ncbi:putative transmembrane protein [Mesoplasma florum]|uniref:Transmembrane protein n=1 Tax=Mesoplasma florum TaxID=2151 RepID=A0AAD0HSB5_MESFO|nr:putative transmembrane protein [Mesoplasma florum]
MLISLLISFKIGTENKNKIGEFRLVLKEELIKYSKSTLVKLIILTLLLGVIYGFVQSPIFRMYFVTNSKINNNDVEWLSTLDRKYQALFIFGQFAIGYTLYKILLPKIGVKNLIYGLIVISGIALLISTFIINPAWMVISNLIFGASYFVLFYMWFGFAIMWNYRATKGVPVTGFIASALLVGQFLVIFVFNSIIYTKSGLFTYQSIEAIIAESNIDNIIAFENNLKIVIRITAAALFFINSIYLFLTVIWIDQVIAEFVDYANIKHIFSEYEKQSVERKINSRIVTE